MSHGVDVDAVVDAGQFICRALGKPNQSRAAQAMLAKRERGRREREREEREKGGAQAA